MRKIILPGKSTRGNLLSTLFTLFLGISERIIILEKAILNKRVLNHPRIRQGFIIAASLLFLLTSFEWTDIPKTALPKPLFAQTEIGAAAVVTDSSVVYSSLVVNFTKRVAATSAETSAAIPLQRIPASCIYLLVRSIRI